jgi:hypothetical protein
MSWFTTIASIIYFGGFIFLIYEHQKEEKKSKGKHLQVTQPSSEINNKIRKKNK